MDNAAADDALIPYQLPFPADALSEIVIPRVIPVDERMWVPEADNVWFRPLCLNRSTGYWMNLLRVRRAGVLSRHRHPNAVSMASFSKDVGATSNMIGSPRKGLTCSNLPAKRIRLSSPTGSRR
jgi:hypothetical protein